MQHYIACLFTSLDYGKRVSPPEEILNNTGTAVKDLATQVAKIRESGEVVGECRAVRINSGKFGVEWQKTKAVLEAGDLDIAVVRPEEEEKADIAGTPAGGNIKQLLTKGRKTKGERPLAGINASVDSAWASERANAKSPHEKQNHGVKRKVEEDPDSHCDDDGDDTKGKEPTQVHPGIAKRRKK